MSRNIRIPQFKEPGLSRFFEDILAAMERGQADKLSKNTANHSVLLVAPSGGVWELMVDDAGVLFTVQVLA